MERWVGMRGMQGIRLEKLGTRKEMAGMRE